MDISFRDWLVNYVAERENFARKWGVLRLNLGRFLDLEKKITTFARYYVHLKNEAVKNCSPKV
jgi:hypothetical protein